MIHEYRRYVIQQIYYSKYIAFFQENCVYTDGQNSFCTRLIELVQF